MEKHTEQRIVDLDPAKLNEDVVITTKISNGDFGGCYIIDKATDQIIHKGLRPFTLGKGRDLRGLTRIIANNIFDLRPFGNTQATHTFTGAVKDSTPITYSKTSTDGVVAIIIEYTFQ